MTAGRRPTDRRPGVVEPGVCANTRVAVIGAGIIGLACAWGLAEAGCAVTLHDDAPATGASFAAAGMITPASEAWFGQDRLLAVSLESAARWPEMARSLGEVTGSDVGWRTSGTVQLAADRDDAATLERHAALLERHGHDARWLTGRELRRLEPALSPRITTGLLLPDESSIDPRRVTTALTSALTQLGVGVHRERVVPVSREGVVVGVAGVDTGDLTPADVVVLAAGWESPLAINEASGTTRTGPDRPFSPAVPVRPVKGQILRLRGEPGVLAHTVRATVHGRFVYLVPRSDGQVVVGATSEDLGPDGRVTAGAVHDLLHDAIEIAPELAELELEESIARFRPATPDNLPLVGRTEIEGLVLACGHGRDGVLLTPITLDAVVAAVTGAPGPRHAHHLDPRRFPGEPTGVTHPAELTERTPC